MLRIATANDFDRIYSLLQCSFPADEYRPSEAQKALLSRPEYTAYVTDDASAVITVWQFNGFAFIEHFAVSPSLRNRGLGSQLLQLVISVLRCPVCLEAELPDTDLAARRIRFYQRCGFFVNPYPYVQPAYSSDRKSVPLLILTSGAPISESEFQTIRDNLYQTVYGIH